MRVSLGCLTALSLAGTAQARTLLSQKEALRLAFPAGEPTRETAYLDDEQVRAAEAAGKVKVESKVWTYYVGVSSGETVYAYFETHVVRSMPETFMAVVGEDGKLRFVELLAFHEPDDYLPSKRWLARFQEKGLPDGLFVRRGVRNIAGASLTSAALADGVRRVLAVHSVLRRKMPE